MMTLWLFFKGANFCLNVFAQNITLHYFLKIFPLSILTGIGLSLVYTSGLLCVNCNFSLKKMLAISIASSGIGIGTLVFPPLLSFMYRETTYQCMYCLSLYFCIVVNSLLQGGPSNTEL